MTQEDQTDRHPHRRVASQINYAAVTLDEALERCMNLFWSYIGPAMTFFGVFAATFSAHAAVRSIAPQTAHPIWTSCFTILTVMCPAIALSENGIKMFAPFARAMIVGAIFGECWWYVAWALSF